MRTMATADSEDARFLQAFVEQYRALHRVLREEVTNLTPETLAWIPCDGANSISVLVTHMLGNEMESVRTVAGVPSDRVRAREFEVRGAGATELVALVDRAEGVLEELAPRITAERLGAMHVRPNALDQTPHTGTHILMHSLAHAREHTGQLLLTRQLAGTSR
jgi:uncharacterized damage-inducible protein DinB